MAAGRAADVSLYYYFQYEKVNSSPDCSALTWSVPPDDLETTEAAGRRGLTQKRGRTFGPQRPRRGARAPHLADVTRSGGAQ